MKKSRIKVECQNCGEVVERTPYQLKRAKNVFCSQACKAEWQRSRVQVACDQCGSVFERTPCVVAANERNFCSKACYAHWRAEAGTEHPDYNRVEVECAHCGRSFLQYPSRVKDVNYCTPECWAKSKVKRVEVICAECGATLWRTPSRIAKGELDFCDNTCRGKWQSVARAGENSSNWQGGHERYYGPNWSPRRREVRERDEDTCQWCGRKQGEGMRLAVHHIVPFVDFGYVPGENENYEEANRLSNLILLCNACHIRADHGAIPADDLKAICEAHHIMAIAWQEVA